MSAPVTTTSRDRVELAHYSTPLGEQRVLVAWRTGPTFMVTDTPEHPDGREYVVDHQIPLAELRALLLDYLEQTATSDVPPADIRRLYPEIEVAS